MAKKRKEATQSNTLDAFFKKGGNDANKKAKLRATEPSQATKRNEKKPSFKVAPEDIIVIDDDDPQELIILDGSSDIEVLEDSPSVAPSSKTAKAGPSNQQARRASHARRSPVSTVEDVDMSFGEPSLLAGEHRSLPKRTDEARPDFGMPTLLHNEPPCSSPPSAAPSSLLPTVRNDTTTCLDGSYQASASSDVPATRIERHPHRPSLDPLQRSNSSDDLFREGTSYTQAPVANATSADQWELGDDEAAEDEITPDDQEVDGRPPLDEQEAADPDDPAHTVCPICNVPLVKLSQLEIQQHVNDCMDATPPSPAKDPPASIFPGPSTCKILRPVPPCQVINVSPEPPDNDALKTCDVKQGGASETGVFSMLMNSHKENEAWKEATIAEDRNFRPTKANGGRRKAPFYKVMQGMPIAVDAFRYGTIPGVTAYFLTHAHSDHYTNLSSNWRSGPIYCSEGTANLIVHMLRVDRKWVHPLPMDVATVIPDTGGVTVTLIEANHCPGSCLFLFEGPQTVNAGDSAYKSPFVGSKRIFRYLHCGDFRASPQHVLHPAVRGKRIDTVYLDTTYLDPKYCFPPQSEVISACAELAKRIVSGESLQADNVKNARVDSFFSVQEKSKDKCTSKNERTLVIVGTYSIGKERIVKAIAKALGSKVYSDSRKTAILRCQADTELDDMLTSDPLEAGVHLLPLGVINSDRLKLYMDQWNGHWTKVVGFRPTGWTFTPANGTDNSPSIASIIAKSQAKSFTHVNINSMKNSTSSLQLYGVPYSEHSSFFELTCFALSFDWGRMIATVNVGTETSRGKMAKWVEKWEAEKKRRGKIEVVQYRSPEYW